MANAEVNINEFGGNQQAVVSTTKTLAEGDCGVVQNVTATTTITLPATTVGFVFLIRVGAEGLTVAVSPNASDKLMGNGFTSADNKDAIATNQPAGSYIMLVGDGVNGYMFQRVHGTWTREA